MDAVATDDLTTYELERGKPMPGWNHSRSQTGLILEFSSVREKYDIASELTLELGGKFYTPDISIYAKRPTDWQHEIVRMTEAPLIAIEILSSSQGFNSISPKIDAYFEHGVQTAWVVHPEIQTVTIFTSPNEKKVHTGGIVTDPKTEISADLSRVFA
ncbi:MAG: Uma2 family endonuclease [Verrucomicrobiales bacterium]|jgi:Uma2 family endonuclease